MKEETQQEVEKEKSPPKKGKKTKTLDADTVNKASNLATQEATNLVLQSIPKTAAGLEKDYNQLKKDTSQVYKYLMNIPTTVLSQLFKTSEVQSEVFSGIL